MTTFTMPTPPAGTRWTLTAGGINSKGERTCTHSATYADPGNFRFGLTAKDEHGNYVTCRVLLDEQTRRPVGLTTE